MASKRVNPRWVIFSTGGWRSFAKALASLHAQLTNEAATQKPGQSGLIALDWNNGNRTILVDTRLSGVVLGQTLAYDAGRYLSRLDRSDRVWCPGHHRTDPGIWRAD